jgi:Asp-tRNA(Asn)/Glu-tRNA(Gln) amidotransferase A subunit family amidase
MKRLVGFTGMLLASSAAAGEPGHSIVQSATVTKAGDVMASHNGAARRICETRARHRPAPELEVPFAVKNLIDIAGIPTLAGSRINRDHSGAAHDARL